MRRGAFTILVGLLAGLSPALATDQASAKVRTTVVPYQHGPVMLEGFLAWDDAVSGKRPGVLVVHEWWGLNAYVRQRAEQLAALGYVAFALDMYGKGMVTQHADQASKWMQQIQANVPGWQERANAGLEILRDHELVDASRLGAIGYCFGGATVLQLAFSGAPVRGVVSFHGALPVPTKEQASQTRAKLLMAHGNQDSFVSQDHLVTFLAALDAGNLDWRLVVYSGARHSFTNPAADAYGMDALKYDKAADVRSWRHMQLFFDELFGTKE
ncbi:MAG: dienelactone hydrolase family protein [Nitrospirales bacterium]